MENSRKGTPGKGQKTGSHAKEFSSIYNIIIYNASSAYQVGTQPPFQRSQQSASPLSKVTQSLGAGVTRGSQCSGQAP